MHYEAVAFENLGGCLGQEKGMEGACRLARLSLDERQGITDGRVTVSGKDRDKAAGGTDAGIALIDNSKRCLAALY
jgi:hypothetical protein